MFSDWTGKPILVRRKPEFTLRGLWGIESPVLDRICRLISLSRCGSAARLRCLECVSLLTIPSHETGEERRK